MTCGDVNGVVSTGGESLVSKAHLLADRRALLASIHRWVGGEVAGISGKCLPSRDDVGVRRRIGSSHGRHFQ